MFAYLTQKIRGRNIILLFLVFAFVFVSFGILVLPKGVAAEEEPLPVCVQKPIPVGSSIASRIIGLVSPFGSTVLTKQIDQYYECTGHIPSVAIRMDRTVECIVACSEATGFAFEYTDREGNPLFCSGALEEATCEIKDSQGTPLTLNLKTGNTDIACDKLNFGCWLKGLLNLIAGILDIFVGSLALLVKAITVTLASVMSRVINYAVSVPVSPSSDQAPGFVKDIWNFSRALANSFFLLILAIIGLTTILRIQSYQWQKTLPSLLIAVLLINFSGVLVGFVVDMANIATTAFLHEAGDTNWKAPPIIGVETLALHVGEILFYSLLAFAYFATMLLFVVRTIVLWILAAIAPLAFALYVLPATKTYWQQWFKALFQWAIMGIPASFAIFFASKAITLTGDSIGGTGAPPAFFVQAAGPFTAAIILLMGMSMALAGAPAVSQSVMKFGKSLPKRLAGTRVGAKVLGGVAGKAATIRAAGRLEGLVGKIPGIGRVAKYAVRPFSMAEGALGAKAIEYAATKRKWQPPKGWDQMGIEEKMIFSKKLGGNDLVQFGAKMGKDITKPQGAEGDAFRKRILAARDRAAKTGYLQESVGTINDIMPETTTKDVRINMKVAMGMSQDAAKAKVEGELKAIVDRVQADAATDNNLRIALDTELASGKTEEDIAAAIKTAEELKPQDIANVANPKTLSFRLAMRTSNPTNLQRIQDNFGREVLEDVFDNVGGINSLTEAQLHTQNPQMHKYFQDNPLGKAMPWKRRGKSSASTPTPTPPVEEQIAGDLAASRTRLQGEIGQLNARAQGLQNFIQQAQGPAGIADSAYQQQLPAWEAELADTHGQVADTERQLRDVSEGLRQIEGLKVPKAPAALPEIQLDMPSQLQGTIKRGSTVVQTIKDMTQEMQKSLGGIRDTQTDFNEVLGEMENVQRQVTELNQQEQLGALGPDLKAKRDELHGNLRDLAQSRRDLGQEIAQQTETAIRAKETIDSKKADLEGIREEITPLQEEYEGVKTREAREARIKQRRKRKS